MIEESHSKQKKRNADFWSLLIHDDVQAKSAVVTQQLFDPSKWNMFRHLAYSPDLAPSDFHLFPDLIQIEFLVSKNMFIMNPSV